MISSSVFKTFTIYCNDMAEGQFSNPYFKKPSQTERLLKSDLWAYLGSAVLMIILVSWLVVRQRWLWIDYITISGNSYLSASQVATATRHALDKPQWLLLSHRFMPITDEAELATNIRAELEQTVSLQSLAVTSDFPNTLVVTLKEYVPGYVYIDGKNNYYIDRTGIVTTAVAASDINPQYPRIRDRNKKRNIALHDQVVDGDVITFIDALLEQFTPATNLDISEFAIPAVTCQAKEYVAEKIFADEIEGTDNKTVKKQKRAILDRLLAKDITVDESLALLEEIKRSEGSSAGAINSTGDAAAHQAYVQWETQYVETRCDYVAVTHDIIVVTQSGLEIVLDSNLALELQLNNLVAVLQNELNNSVAGLSSIDLRYEDKVYYK